jgi:hypothetical protein
MRLLAIVIIFALPAVAALSDSPQSARHTGQPKEKVKSPQPSADPQGAYKRLILKDGSYQPISQYEIRGDVVRYFSSERHEWEVVPYALVDWPATDSYAKQSAVQRQAHLKQSAEADAQERSEAEARTPWVTAGIRLPETGGVFLLDTFQGRPELNQLHQKGANINKNTAGNILRGVINPIASTKRTIELEGLHARVQSHVADPAIYVALDTGNDPSADYTPEPAKDRFRLVRCEQQKGNRLVGVLTIAVYGKVKRDATFVETNVEPVSEHWVKVTSATPLPPGEYALVELLGKEGLNTFVWDFGVNASAPENRNARKAEPVRADNPPVLQKRQNPAKP